MLIISLSSDKSADTIMSKYLIVFTISKDSPDKKKRGLVNFCLLYILKIMHLDLITLNTILKRLIKSEQTFNKFSSPFIHGENISKSSA